MESVLAMGLVAASLSFAIAMHARVMAADRSSKRIQAWMLSERIIAARLTGNAGHGTDHAHLTAVVEEVSVAPGLLELRIVCSHSGREILDRRSVIPQRP